MPPGERSSPSPILIGVAIICAILAAFLFFPSRTRDARVSGKVTLDGEPVPGAQVVFLGADEQNRQPVIAVSSEDGSYQLVGNSGAGISPGKYKVSVTKMATKDGKLPAGEGLLKAQSEGLLQNVLPKKYEDSASTPFQFDLAAGNTTIDLAMSK